MPNIIVVDDDPTNTTLIKMLLELEGFDVIATSDISQAKAAASEDTDAFLVDCNLARGASGLDLAVDIRQGKTAALAEVVVIVTSGDYRLDDDAYRVGADFFLLKPYPPDLLSSKLRHLLAEKGKHAE